MLADGDHTKSEFLTQADTGAAVLFMINQMEEQAAKDGVAPIASMVQVR